jgi:crotonobetainyl-CoA:carnitine CoA-transferase CaiB-like acyl-CoA transferase
VKALAGLRLLDLTHMLSGPYCAMMLADLGMEVIKVEPLSGERTRSLLATHPEYSRDGVGSYFLALGRNKKSVAIDLKSTDGRAVFDGLVARSDVVLTNFAVGVAERLGVDHGRLSTLNPRLVSCAISGFGQEGPRAREVAFDMVVQALGGGMSITGEPGGRPMRAGLPIGDLGGGLMATIGILAALQARERTGVGQLVDISMLDAQISMQSYMATMTALSGRAAPSMANAHPVHVPYDVYPTSDGWIVVAVIFDPFWGNLMAALDLPELDTPENARQPGRHADREQIDAALSGLFRTNTRAHWAQVLREARVPCAPVHDLAEALADP